LRKGVGDLGANLIGIVAADGSLVHAADHALAGARAHVGEAWSVRAVAPRNRVGNVEKGREGVQVQVVAVQVDDVAPALVGGRKDKAVERQEVALVLVGLIVSASAPRVAKRCPRSPAFP
jgi:hypothetical protein